MPEIPVMERGRIEDRWLAVPTGPHPGAREEQRSRGPVVRPGIAVLGDPPAEFTEGHDQYPVRLPQGLETPIITMKGKECTGR